MNEKTLAQTPDKTSARVIRAVRPLKGLTQRIKAPVGKASIHVCVCSSSNHNAARVRTRR